ncbi:MAG: hypothetical protein ACOYKE_01385 [Ferruginibacter sp.]
MIDINRHNYEMFFLLYVDKELSAEDCLLVENFVQQNPDLAAELKQFEATVLHQPVISFFDKSALLRSAVFNSPIQDKLLTAIDQELPEDELQALQEIIETNPIVKDAWTVLQQCKLDASEEIIYPNKANLYQTEKHKVRPVFWWRIAAAAMLIGAGTWGAVQYIQQKNKGIGGSTVVVASPSNSSNSTKVLSNQNNTGFNPNTDEIVVSPVTNTNQNQSTSAAQTAITKDEKLITPQKEKSSLDNFNSNTSNEKNTTIVVVENSGVPKNSGITGNDKPETTKETNATTANNVVLNTSLTEEAMPIVYNTLSVDEEEPRTKRTRVGGLFRKLKRALNRNANPEAEKKGLRVASFQIAIH